jgi:hypothetical protein
VEVTFVVGPRTTMVAPVFSVFDRDRKENFLLGADGDDLVLHVRRLAVAGRFNAPDLRWHGALAGHAQGDTLRVVATHDRAGAWCLERRARDSADRRCGLQLRASTGWALLLFPEPSERVRRALNAFWLACLVLPAAFFLRRSAVGVATALGLGAALVWLPPALGLATMGVADGVGISAGALAGAGLGQLLRGNTASSASRQRSMRA